MTAAAAHWAEYREMHTGDKKRRMEAVLLKVFIEATLAADKDVERIRSIKSVDKKIKNMRERYNEACKDLKKTRLSTPEEDRILLKFGCCVLLNLC